MTGAGNMGMGMGMRMRRWSICVHGRCHTPHHCHAMPSIDNNGIEDVHLKSIQAILERNKAERAAAELAGAVREAAVEKAAMVKALAEAAKASEELQPLALSLQLRRLREVRSCRACDGAPLLAAFEPLLKALAAPQSRDPPGDDSSASVAAALQLHRASADSLLAAQAAVEELATATPVDEAQLAQAVTGRDEARLELQQAATDLASAVLVAACCASTDVLRERVAAAARAADIMATAHAEALRVASAMPMLGSSTPAPGQYRNGRTEALAAFSEYKEAFSGRPHVSEHTDGAAAELQATLHGITLVALDETDDERIASQVHVQVHARVHDMDIYMCMCKCKYMTWTFTCACACAST